MLSRPHAGRYADLLGPKKIVVFGLCGCFLSGVSYLLAALGVVAVKVVPQQNQGSALATYTIFMDLSLGVTGPLAGLLMAYAGGPMIYLAAAVLVFIALILVCLLKKTAPGRNTGGRVITILIT